MIRADEWQKLTKIDECRLITSGVTTVPGNKPGLRNLAVVQ